MNKLAKNKFLTGMAALFGIALVAYAVLVFPAGNTASGHNEAIKKEVGKVNLELADLPGEPNVKTWSDQSESLKKRYADAFQKQLEKDQVLGQWFTGIDDNSTLGTFVTPYDDQRDKLEKELLEKGVELGSPVEKNGRPEETRTPGFNWIQRDNIQRADTQDKEMHAKEILQKRFNISRAIVNAVTDGVDKTKLPKRRLLDVTFLERFPYLPAGAGGISQEAKSYTITIDTKRYIGYSPTGSSSYAELNLPLSGDEPSKDGETAEKSPDPTAAAKKPVHLGRTITFGFAVVMDYSQVPVLMRKLIDPDAEMALNLTIVGMNIFVPEPNPYQITEKKTLGPGETQATLDKVAEELTASSLPPQVHVYFTCQVFDIDPAAVPSFLKQ